MITSFKLMPKQFILVFLLCITFFDTSGQGDHSGPGKSSFRVAHFGPLARKIRDGSDTVSAFLKKQLAPQIQEQLNTYKDTCPPSESLEKALSDEIERIVSESSLYDAPPFKGVPLSAETQRLLQEGSKVKNRIELNRSLLADAYSFEISRSDDPAAGNPYNPEHFPTDATCYPKIDGSEVRNLFQKGGISRRTIPAELLATVLIKRPKDGVSEAVDITSCFIEGDLVLSNREVFRPLLVDNSNFGGQIVIDGAKVHDTFGLEATTVAYFKGDKTSFQDSFYVNLSKFTQGASFERTEFLDWADFGVAAFSSDEGVENSFTVFDGARFARGASFDAVKFDSNASFDETRFEGGTSFDLTAFLGETSFRKTHFADVVSFRSASIVRPLIFAQVVFPTSVTFDGFHGIRPREGESADEKSTPSPEPVPEGAPVAAMSVPETKQTQLRRLELAFYGTTFRGVTSFDRLNVTSLRFPTTGPTLRGKRQAFSPLVCEKPVSFSSMTVDNADFSHADFRDHADFTKSRFNTFANFNHATFRDTVSFANTEFPSPDESDTARTGLHLDKARFFKSLHLEWKQLHDGRLVTEDTATWATLEAAFKTSGNVTSQNEAYFNRRQLDAKDFGDYLAWISWGYGVRPWGLLGWILLIQLLFTLLYWTQTRFMAGRSDRRSWHTKRLAFAVDFGWRTALSWRHGITNSRSQLFRLVTLVHAVGLKMLLVLLFICVANVSPLLHSIITKLVPI